MHIVRQNIDTNEDLIESLRDSDQIVTPEVEQAMLLFKREYFLTEDLLDTAYIDTPLRFAKMGFNISAPHMHAHCLEALDIKEGNRILDIGCGSGYITAVGAYLAGPTGHCLGIDIHQHIIDFCAKNIKICEEKTNVPLKNITLQKKNCFLPFPPNTKFDRIHVGACCPESYIQMLYALLDIGGIIVTPYNDQMLKATKLEDGTMNEETILRVRYSDLVLPSDAEIKEAEIELEKELASKVEIPQSTFQTDMESLITNPEEADITFAFENNDTKLWAHKAILKKRSGMFKAMFTSGMKETEGMLQTLKVDGDPTVFKQLLKYIYTDECDITGDNCLDLLQLSNYYKVDRLTCMCEVVIRDSVNIEDAATVLYLADKYNAVQLKSFITEYILENLEAVIKTDSYKQLDKEMTDNLMLKLYSRSKGLK